MSESTELDVLRASQEHQMVIEKVIAKLVAVEPKITTIATVLDAQTPEVRTETFSQFASNPLLTELFPAHVEMMKYVAKLYE